MFSLDDCIKALLIVFALHFTYIELRSFLCLSLGQQFYCFPGLFFVGLCGLFKSILVNACYCLDIPVSGSLPVWPSLIGQLTSFNSGIFTDFWLLAFRHRAHQPCPWHLKVSALAFDTDESLCNSNKHRY